MEFASLLPNAFYELYSLAAVALLFALSGVRKVRKEPCLTGEFDAQLRYIMHQQMYSDNIFPVLDDVRTTLSQRWEGLKMVPFGSTLIGLAIKSSDVDIIVKLRNMNSSEESYVLYEAERLFMKQPELYSDINVRAKHKYPHLAFFHIPSQRRVDLLLKYNHVSVNKSKLLKYYFNLDERHLVLGRFLKYWFKLHDLTANASDKLSGYELYLMIIFYLQQKNMAPPVYVLHVDSKSDFVKNWDLGFNNPPYRSANPETVHQLLGGFFRYYSEFDFDGYIISPFAGRPIPRNAFIDIDKFPIEFSLNNSILNREIQLRLIDNLNIGTAVCIQDILELDINVGERVSQTYATKYKSLYKYVARMFKELPSDKILRSIIVMDQFKGTISHHSNAIVDRINDCIDIPDL